MITRRAAFLIVAAVPLAIALPVAAAEKFKLADLEAAQKADKMILVEIAAPWCPTCRAQKPILEGLAKNEKFKEFVFFKVDFDSQKEELRKLNARSQSTLIVFKGAKEVGRSVGDTKAASIEALFAKALDKAPDSAPEKAPDKAPEKTPDKAPEKTPDKPT